jgi:hypothetical protein
MRVAIFMVLFAGVFVISTVLSSETVGNGTDSFSSYGWPKTWLHITSVVSQITMAQDGKTTSSGDTHQMRTVAWQPLFLSAGVAVGIAAVLSSPFLFWPKRKKGEGYDHVA